MAKQQAAAARAAAPVLADVPSEVSALPTTLHAVPEAAPRLLLLASLTAAADRFEGRDHARHAELVSLAGRLSALRQHLDRLRSFPLEPGIDAQLRALAALL